MKYLLYTCPGKVSENLHTGTLANRPADLDLHCFQVEYVIYFVTDTYP